MKRVLVTLALATVLAFGGSADAARGGGGHGGGFGGHPGGFHGPGGFHRGFHGGFHGHGPRVFFGGSVFFDPFFYGPYYYPYYPYYPYPYPGYVYPPPPDYTWSAPPPEEGEGQAEAPPPAESDEEASRATYGLIQLRGVPDGASVDLDGRFWLTAQHLDQRWLAVPRGEHTLTVRVRGSEPAERRIDVVEGKNQVIRFGPFRHATG